MIRYIGLFFLALLIAFIFIYVIGFLWFVISLFFFSSHFENFQAIDIEGRFIERLSFLLSFATAYLIAIKQDFLFKQSRPLSKNIYLSIELMLVMGLSVIISFLMTYGIGLLTINMESNLLVDFSSISYQLFIIAIANNLMVSLGEEMIYRGIIFTYLLKKTGELKASLIISALTFSMLHFNYSQPISFFLAFGGGWIFAYSYHHSKTLIVPVGMHFSYNFFMEIFQSDDQIYLNKILETDLIYIDGIGDSFAIFRLFFLSLVIFYTIKRFRIYLYNT